MTWMTAMYSALVEDKATVVCFLDMCCYNLSFLSSYIARLTTRSCTGLTSHHPPRMPYA